MDFKVIERFTNCYCFISNTSYNDIRGVIDIGAKIRCCFMLVKYLNIPMDVVSKFFKINPNYLDLCIKDLMIEQELSDTLKGYFNDVNEIFNTILVCEKLTKKNA